MGISIGRALIKRAILIVGGLALFVFLLAVACRITMEQILESVEQSRATGLSASTWDSRSMWNNRGRLMPVDLAQASSPGTSISRSAELRERSSSFDRSDASLHEVVSTHHGYFDELRTESHSGQGRLLSVVLAVPAAEFDATLSDLQKIGHVVAISEAGEDAADRVASEARRLSAAQTNLARLQKLQRERTDKLLDALTLEKEIAQANEAVGEAQRQQEALQSTVALAHIAFTLLEDYRAPLDAQLDGEPLRLHNALVEGVGAIFSTVGLVLRVVLAYGLPMLFWFALLFFPMRLAWRHFSRWHAVTAVAN
jgi:hypothetical protein